MLSFSKYKAVLVWSFLVMSNVVIGQPASKSVKPNVILILTDDQGYGDLSVHGNPYLKTPNMDKIHANAVRFTNFHVDPTCAPTRAALLTGKYAHHVGVWHTVSGGNHLRAEETTMADHFKQAGYNTGLFGKWHLGSNYPYRPIDRGFDEWLGQGDGGTGTTDDWFDNDRVNDHYWHNGESVEKLGFTPDVFYDNAIEFITASANKSEPFFVYLPTYLPHGPHTLPDRSSVEKYKGKIPDYVAYFFASIERVDWNIGRLRKALEKLKIDDNTLLIFMSDNGGTAGVNLYNAGMRGRKGQVYEGGHRVPFFVSWPNGGMQQKQDIHTLTSHIDVLPSLIEMCGLPNKGKADFDGRSFAKQLFNPNHSLPDRTLFVETQRNYSSIPWENTVGMKKHWRLVNNTELYDLTSDPGQTKNVFDTYPKVVNDIQKQHESYWSKVAEDDRKPPRFIVGSEADKEVFLHPSDWYLPDVPWNHAQVGKGSTFVGEWNITAETKNDYIFEVRRWPKEANTAITGIPTFKNKQVDAWQSTGGISKLIYGSSLQAIAVKSVRLKVGEKEIVKPVSKNKKCLRFSFSLEAGDYTVKGEFLDASGNVISGTYYVYVSAL